LFLIFLGKI